MNIFKAEKTIFNDETSNTGEHHMTPEEREATLKKLIQNEGLIEAGPSFDMLLPSVGEGGSIFYGTGLTTPTEISQGLPFDVLGMMFVAEKIRKKAEFDSIYHHIADTHAKTNDWIDHLAVDAIANTTVKTLDTVASNLGLDHFNFLKASDFDQTPEYGKLLDEFASSAQHEYVVREAADIEWYRQYKGVALKIGWIIQAAETELGTDERVFDREYSSFIKEGMSFIYTKPGRTLNPSRPKASPYVATSTARRIMLEPDTDVHEVLRLAEEESGDAGHGGALKQYKRIVAMYEDQYGSLGKFTPDFTLADKIQKIIDHCFRGNA